ncbi:MAG: cbb3-type cytochrome c oxidase subunit I [Aigarchaeota archaeon]|nr:cbb3-type cytochrome c oxidase subunit I [Aigarchaeota archaeon]MDW8093276.1 cbb3-type cytochrome c oxidase subunit I [Nitrososphaerota archaeon]
MAEHEVPPAWSVKRWLTTTNHKDIGILYIVTSLFFLVVAGLLALIFRIQLFAPNLNFLSANSFNQMVSIHGLMMILWFLSPFAFGLANYVVPLQIGARDLAFPRLNALSYWLYAFSGVALVVSFFQQSTIDFGWTLYAPINTAQFSPYVGVNTGGLALLLLVTSVTISTVNFLVTIIYLRAPGMKLRNMPMFSWSILITVAMMLFAFPPLLAAILMLVADRALNTIFFVAPEGGAILWDHLFWFFGHPEVYIVLFPAIGAICDVIPTFTRRPLYGRTWIIGAMIAAAVISFTVWGHHMFNTGINPDVRKAFTVTTIAVSLPFDVMVFAFIYTFAKGRIKLNTPFLITLEAIFLFIIGGVTGVFLASVALDYALRGTYWVVAHFHYVMAGGAAIGLISGLFYWFPKMTGRMFNEKLGRAFFIVSFAGFNLLYFSMFIVWEMPRRVVTYLPETGWGFWNTMATVGGFIFGLSFLILFWDLLRSALYGTPAGPNPWNGTTLEWAIPSPPPFQNYEGQPVVTEEGFKFVSMNGAPHVEHESHMSPWPFLIGLATLAFVIGFTTNFYFFLAASVFGLVTLLGLVRERFVVHDPKLGERWPFLNIEKVKLGFWTFLASEVVLFGTVISCYVYLRFNSSAWPAPGTIFNIEHGAVNTFILLSSSFTAVLALLASKVGNKPALIGGLAGTLALGAAFLVNKFMEWRELFDHGVTFSSSLPGTTFFFTTGLHGAHVTAGLIVLVFLIYRAFKGWYLKHNHETIEYFGLYWHFVDIVWVFLFPLFYMI